MRKALAWILALLLLASCIPASASVAFAQTALDDPDSARAANVQLAASAINQTRILYGETFSFNAVVGPRTEERGYVSAVNGRGAEVTGGGVGQAASTLYLALCGLEPDSVTFDALSVYGDSFTGGYLDDGDQAVLVDYGDGVDFCFTNYAATEMILEMWLSEGYLCCSVSLSNWAEVEEAATADSFVYAQTAPAPSIPTRIARVKLTCADNDALRSNIALAADSIYDTTLTNGDTFSFNDVVGPREERFGYATAVNGRGAEVTGGGVGQVASALWLSIKNLSDFSIVEKATYGTRYNQSYVSNSADAILIDYNAGTDFVFKYTGSGCVTLYTWLEDDTLYCEIYRND